MKGRWMSGWEGVSHTAVVVGPGLLDLCSMLTCLFLLLLLFCPFFHKGGQILGKYPSRLDESNSQNIYNSGGRFIPTTSWEAVWKPIAEWFGVLPEEIPNVLPNLDHFPTEHIITQNDMFE